MNPGSAVPKIWKMEDFSANAGWGCLFLEGWESCLIWATHSMMASSASAVFWPAAETDPSESPTQTRFDWLRGACWPGKVFSTSFLGDRIRAAAGIDPPIPQGKRGDTPRRRFNPRMTYTRDAPSRGTPYNANSNAGQHATAKRKFTNLNIPPKRHGPIPVHVEGNRPAP